MKANAPMPRVDSVGRGLIVLAMLVTAGCRDDSLDPADALSARHESAHYIYLHAPDDAVNSAMQEQYHE